MPSLQPYRRKRDFAKTPEPAGTDGKTLRSRFVVHKHWASSDHYDLRLELDGVLKCWAVPKGPSLDPADKRLAMATEDHPIEYIGFEGVIPDGEYGGGPMIVWDTGDWAPMGDPRADIAMGAFKFRLAGEKLRGGWMLTRLKPKAGAGNAAWLLFKEQDRAADSATDVLVARPESVKSGRRIEELLAPPPTLATSLPRTRGQLLPGRIPNAVRAAFPERHDLQLATASAALPNGSGWLHEIKYDGYRTLAVIRAGATRLITRGGLDWTARYGDLPAAFERLGVRQAIVDGEIVVLNAKGVSSFSGLQQALSENAPGRLAFFAFDLLHLNGWNLTGAPLVRRKELLAQILSRNASAHSPIQFSDHITGDAYDLLERVSDLGLEGIISKRETAPYVAGRSASWLKIKAHKLGEFTIAGFSESSAAGGIGALAVGQWTDGELHYRGKIGTGFDTETMKMLVERLGPLRGGDRLPGMPPEIIPVRPTLSARVQYATLTSDNRLRHAVFKGLREAQLSTPGTDRERLISDADLAGIWVTNPTRRLFGRSGPTKLDIAVYYASVGDYMLPHLFNRPVSLFRCPTGKPGDCFFQRHPFVGMPPGLETLEVGTSGEEIRTYFAVEDVKAYLALAQFGVVEFHTWGAQAKAVETPDRVTFDLDPGEGVTWREVVNAAVHLRGELQALGLVPFVKTSGGKGLHIIVPIKPELPWKTVHDRTGTIAARLAATGRDTFVTLMGAQNRKRRIFIDFHRNARTSTTVAAYSLRARPHLPSSTPVDWRDLESIDSPEDLNYSSLPSLLTTSVDPWAKINVSARDLPS